MRLLISLASLFVVLLLSNALVALLKMYNLSVAVEPDFDFSHSGEQSGGGQHPPPKWTSDRLGLLSNCLSAGIYTGNPCLRISPNRISRSWEYPLRRAYDTYRQEYPNYWKRASGELCRQDSQCSSERCMTGDATGEHMPVCA